MIDAIYLPKLNKLTPTLDSTLMKIMEEAGELARAVLAFLPYEQLKNEEKQGKVKDLLSDVSGELLDVAQTCTTMIFVMEEFYEVQVDGLIDEHLEKLVIKGYDFDKSLTYNITTLGNYKYLNLPRLLIKDVNLLKTVCKIQEEIGELTQYLGKGAGASGERQKLNKQQILMGCAQELLDVAQCCFTMMYILADEYQVDIKELTKKHIAKLQNKGYCA